MARELLIDREAVINTAMWIASHEGLAAVTMQRVADGLGVTPMALYRHVSNKRGLLDGMVRRLLHDIPEPPEWMPWRERLRWLAEVIRANALEHRAVFALLLQHRETHEGVHVRLVVVDALARSRRAGRSGDPHRTGGQHGAPGFLRQRCGWPIPTISRGARSTGTSPRLCR